MDQTPTTPQPVARVEIVADLEQAIAQQEHALSVLIGRNPGPIRRGRSLQTLVAPAVPSGLPSELIARRPDILQSEQQLVSANALVGAVGPLVGGRGGGKDDVAQGGGSDASRIDEALAVVVSEIGRVVGG